MKTPLSILLAIAALLAAFRIGCRFGERQAELLPETKIRIDTVFYEKPQPIRVSEPVFTTVRLPRLIFARDTVATGADTIRIVGSDSADVCIPITRHEYRDSNYRAVVSGYMASLDRIEVYPHTVYTTQTITRRSRFAVTAGVGIGYTPQGFRPHAGISVGVILWQW